MFPSFRVESYKKQQTKMDNPFENEIDDVIERLREINTQVNQIAFQSGYYLPLGYVYLREGDTEISLAEAATPWVLLRVKRVAPNIAALIFKCPIRNSFLAIDGNSMFVSKDSRVGNSNAPIWIQYIALYVAPNEPIPPQVYSAKLQLYWDEYGTIPGYVSSPIFGDISDAGYLVGVSDRNE
jgi:hypothetical protein